MHSPACPSPKTQIPAPPNLYPIVLHDTAAKQYKEN